jgi:hypothetical protein
VISLVAPLEYDAKASKNWKEETTLDASTNHCPERNRGFQINQYETIVKIG